MNIPAVHQLLCCCFVNFSYFYNNNSTLWVYWLFYICNFYFPCDTKQANQLFNNYVFRTQYYSIAFCTYNNASLVFLTSEFPQNVFNCLAPCFIEHFDSFLLFTICQKRWRNRVIAQLLRHPQIAVFGSHGQNQPVQIVSNRSEKLAFKQYCSNNPGQEFLKFCKISKTGIRKSDVVEVESNLIFQFF